MMRLLLGGLVLALSWLSPGDLALAQNRYALPLVLSASEPARQGVVRIVNRSDRAGTVRIHAIDDTGERFGPIYLELDAKASVQLNSADLESGDLDKGLSGGVGDGEGDWRLELDTDLDIEPFAFVRTSDGFLTSVHERVAEAGRRRYHVPVFYPVYNGSMASRLRLVNPTDTDAEVVIEGVDDRGESGEEEVSLALAAGVARTLGAEELESGGSGLSGRLGNGAGMWRLFVSADRALEVMSLLRGPGGHLSNLSAGLSAGAPSASDEFDEEARFVITASSPSIVPPLEEIALVASPGLSPGSDYTVLMDVSGTGGFAGEYVVEITGLTTDRNEVLVAAPMRQHLAEGNASGRFAVKVRHEPDGRLSNPLHFSVEEVTIPARFAGIPTTVLEVILQQRFVQSESEWLNRQAEDMPAPGQLVVAASRLGVDTTFSDVQAEAILRSLFDVSILDILEEEEARGAEAVEAELRATVEELRGRLADVEDRLMAAEAVGCRAETEAILDMTRANPADMDAALAATQAELEWTEVDLAVAQAELDACQEVGLVYPAAPGRELAAVREALPPAPPSGFKFDKLVELLSCVGDAIKNFEFLSGFDCSRNEYDWLNQLSDNTRAARKMSISANGQLQKGLWSSFKNLAGHFIDFGPSPGLREVTESLHTNIVTTGLLKSSLGGRIGDSPPDDCVMDYCSGADGRLIPSPDAYEKDFDALQGVSAGTTEGQDEAIAAAREDLEENGVTEEELEAFGKLEAESENQRRDAEELEAQGESYLPEGEEEEQEEEQQGEEEQGEEQQGEEEQGEPEPPKTLRLEVNSQGQRALQSREGCSYPCLGVMKPGETESFDLAEYFDVWDGSRQFLRDRGEGMSIRLTDFGRDRNVRSSVAGTTLTMELGSDAASGSHSVGVDVTVTLELINQRSKTGRAHAGFTFNILVEAEDCRFSGYRTVTSTEVTGDDWWSYEGQCLTGFAHGQGRLELDMAEYNERTQQSNYEMMFVQHLVYEGEFRHGAPHGEGHEMLEGYDSRVGGWTNTTEGEFRDGSPWNATTTWTGGIISGRVGYYVDGRFQY